MGGARAAHRCSSNAVRRRRPRLGVRDLVVAQGSSSERGSDQSVRELGLGITALTERGSAE